MLAKNRDEQDQVDALTTRYVTGDISETVYMVSLHRFLDVDDIRYLVLVNQLAHRNSLPYKRGDVR